MSVITTLLLLTPTLSLAQHNSRIQDLVESLKNSPRHQSISPSYTSDRKFDVIGSGELPLQSSSSLDDSLLPDIIDRYDKYPGDDDHDNVEDEAVVDKDSVGSDSAPFMAPLSVQLTDTESKDEDPLLSQGSRPRRISRPSGPKPYRRRQQHYQKHGHSAPGLRLRPIGDVLTNIIRPNRKIPQDRKGPLSPRPGRFSSQDRKSLNQEPVPDFYPQPDLRPPGRPKRQRPGKPVPNHNKKPFSLSNPFKNILDKSPLKKKHQKPRLPPRKGDSFRPPNKVFNGFAPSFKGSISLDEARRQYEKDKYENQQLHHDDGPRFESDHDDDHGEPPKRKRRRKPGGKRKRLPHKNGVPDHMDDVHTGHIRPEPDRRPLLVGEPERRPDFDSDPRPHEESIRPAHTKPPTLAPFTEDVVSFSPPSPSPGDIRPKRQRPRPVIQDDLLPPQTMFNDAPEDNLGFFNEVGFPDISEFGVGWDPQKIRRKREAREYPYYNDQRRLSSRRPSRRPPPPRSYPRQQSSRSSRRQGPGGFWDDPDFDADFFSNGGPSRPSSFDSYVNKNSYDSYSNKYPQQQQQQYHSYYPQQQSPPSPYSQQRPYREQSRPKIKPTRYVDRYSIQENAFNSLEQDNSILGSGNFEILKGGTFYDKDDYRRPFGNTRPTKHSSYYGGGNDIFHNFKDFADIKRDAKKGYNNYDEGYYY